MPTSTNETIYVFGGQIEESAAATSLIFTDAAAVTRAADVAPSAAVTRAGDTITLPVDGWYRQDEGTFAVAADTAGGTDRIAFAVSDGTFNNTMYMNVNTPGLNLRPSLTIRAAGANQSTVNANGPETQYGKERVYAAAYKVGSAAASADGAAPGGATPGTLPQVHRLYIGSGWSGGNVLNGHARRLAYMPRRLPNEDLQRLSTR